MGEFHATLSPSARHRWGACPGSVREESKYPPSQGGQAANDGTRTHALLERLIRFEFIDKKGKCGPLPCYGETITDEYGTYMVDSDRAARLNVAMEYVRKCVEETGNTPIPETRVYPDGLVGRADMSGTVDVQIPGKDVYIIIDYKDGMAPVEAKDNPQLEQYALGVLAGLDQDKLPKKFRFVIIQPKLATRGLAVVSTHEVTTAELQALIPVVKAQADATDDPEAPLVPGESQCKYCRAKGACAALSGKMMGEVSMMFSAVPAITPEVIPAGVLDPAQQAAAKDPTVMDDHQLRQLMEAAPLVRQMLKGVEDEIERRIKAGHPVAGFKLVEGPGRRAWALPEDEMVKKLTAMGIPKGSVYEQTLLGPAKAEKLVWEKKGVPCKLSDRQIKSMNTEYITKKPGSLVVVSDADPRPAAVGMDTSAMFAPVDPPPLALPAFLQPLPSFLL